MKKSMLSVLLTMFALGNSVADTESSEIFPLSGITVGMSSKELLEKYPAEDILFAKEDDDEILKEGVVFYKIPANTFWDTLIVSIEDSKIQMLGYFYANDKLFSQDSNAGKDYGKIVQNIKPLFKQLKQQLGSTFERKVAYYNIGETKTRSAMYVWKREQDIVAFAHSPASQYKKGDDFDCQLIIVSSIEVLEGLGDMATDRIPEDAALWADAMGEEKTGSWLFLIIGVSAAIGAVAVWGWGNALRNGAQKHIKAVSLTHLGQR